MKVRVKLFHYSGVNTTTLLVFCTPSCHLWEPRVEAVLQGADLHVLRHQRNGPVEELVHLAPAVQNAQGCVFLKLSHFLWSPLILLSQS